MGPLTVLFILSSNIKNFPLFFNFNFEHCYHRYFPVEPNLFESIDVGAFNSGI